MFRWLFAPISGRELWCRLPVVDRATCNWSATRTAGFIALLYWGHVAEKSHTFNWPSVAVLALVSLLFLSKNVTEFEGGLRAIGSAFRRRSSDRVHATTLPRDSETL